MSDQWINAAQRLVDVLQQENTALQRLDFHAAVALVPAKEAALANLAKPRMPPVPPAALAQRLAGLAAENRTLLQRAIAVQTRIVQIVARASAPPPATMRYNGYGGRTPAQRSSALAVSTRA
jgi:hypothetical protein